jgi:ApaG protein
MAVIVSEATYQITVGVSTTYVEDQSQPEQNRYVFAYTVTLRNTGRTAAQLMTRHWIITDATGQVQEVRGDGVVGEQPRLEPGESYRYTSGAVIETPVGTMTGSYHMIADDGVGFEAPIPMFRLSVPNVLH